MTPPDLEAALQYFEQALEYDPDYALAYAGIALVWAIRSQFGSVRARDALPPMTAAAERAVELDSTLVEVQSALAAVRTWHLWDWAGAEAAFERAIEINPNYPDVRTFYSHFLLHMHRHDGALRQSQLAVELDPFNPITQGFHGMVLFFVGRYDEAIAQYQRLLRTVPNHPVAYSGLADVYHVQGMYEESLAAARSYHGVRGFSEMEEALAGGYAEAGYEGARRRAAETFTELSRVTYVSPWDIAWQYAAAGEDSLALEWLEQGFEERDPNMPYLSVRPVFAGMRDDPRFQALLQRMNLPQR
jgi:tetratricopeptide (TPR) repeat protein